MGAASPYRETNRFEALIIPHRSLSPRGLRILAGSLVVLTALIALRFWFLGAWPIVAISGPEIALTLFLLHLNIRQSRARELVMLTDETVRIVRTDPSGARRRIELPTAWLSIALEEAPGRVPRLLLRNRTDFQEIGRALGEDEKRDLAAALRSALHDARNPRFDNPQLREDPAPAA
jgi:uncharacterized membrane protein